MYHDQKTSGVMGFLPLVKNMPLPITATDPRNKSILFRANTVYYLDGHCTRKTKSESTDATVAADSCRDHISQDEAVAANSCRDHISQDEADSLPDLY